MRASHAFIGAILWFATLVSLSEGLGNCSSALVFGLRRENTYYEIRGLFVRVLPSRNFEPLYNIGEISWEPYMVVERNKTLTTMDGRPFIPGLAVCQVPGGYDVFSPDYDPAFVPPPGDPCPGSPNTACGALLQTWRSEDFDCFTESYKHTIAGVNVETVVVHTWLAGHPGTFVFNAFYHLAEQDFNYTIPRDLYKDSTIIFTKDVMKMSYELSNIPWYYDNSPPGIILDPQIRDSISFLSLFYRLTMKSSLKATLKSHVFDGFSTTYLHSDDGTFKLFLRLDLDTVLDNITSVSPSPSMNATVIQVAPNTVFSGAGFILFCPLNQGHWNLMEYDPSISALFSGGPESSPEAPNSSSNLSQGAIAGISVGACFVVLGLVVAVVMLSTHNEAFKRMIRPFSARKHAGAHISTPGGNHSQPLQAADSPTSQSAWASPTKPPNM